MGKTESANHGQSRRPEGAAVEPTETVPAPKDVWSRTGSKYRVRAVVLLAVNVLLFAGVGSFAYWLRTGVRFAPVREGYGDELRQTFGSVPLWGQHDASASLGSLLLEPINVQDVPMQIPIVGLLMAALISIPILTSLLYRFWSCIPFLVVVGFLAVMPWLALTLLVSCIIVSARPLRLRFRFVSALLGLLPAVLYLVLAWYGTTDLVAGRIDPVDRVKFIAPWVLAIVAAAVVFAVVLAIAKLVDYRPGALTPLLAIMFGLPVALFEWYVGRDELYYRLLAAASEGQFADVDASAELDLAVQQAWERHAPPRPSKEAVRETVETRWLFELASDIEPIRSALTRHQAELVDQADRFLTSFPDSRHAFRALLIKARALDMRADPGEFRRTKWIRYYDSFPSPASRETWRMIVENRPDGVLGAVAILRLAQIDAREGDVERAIARLDELRRRLGVGQNDEQASTARPSLGSVLAHEHPDGGLPISMERVLLEARWLSDLLASNRDPIYGYDPITGPRRSTDSFSFGLLDLDPRHEDYVDNLQRLKTKYPNCQIEDNIDLLIANATTETSLKIERLEACLARFPDRDQAPEALFRLGMAFRDANDLRRADAVLSRLAREYPASVWTEQAAQYGPRPGVILGWQTSPGDDDLSPGGSP